MATCDISGYVTSRLDCTSCGGALLTLSENKYEGGPPGRLASSFNFCPGPAVRHPGSLQLRGCSSAPGQRASQSRRVCLFGRRPTWRLSPWRPSTGSTLFLREHLGVKDALWDAATGRRRFFRGLTWRPNRWSSLAWAAKRPSRRLWRERRPKQRWTLKELARCGESGAGSLPRLL